MFFLAVFLHLAFVRLAFFFTLPTKKSVHTMVSFSQIMACLDFNVKLVRGFY